MLLGQVREQAGRARENRHSVHGARETEVSRTAAMGMETFIGSGFAPNLGTASRKRAREQDVGPARAACVGELEDPLGAWVERAVHRMAESGHLVAGG